MVDMDREFHLRMNKAIGDAMEAVCRQIGLDLDDVDIAEMQIVQAEIKRLLLSARSSRQCRAA